MSARMSNVWTLLKTISELSSKCGWKCQHLVRYSWISRNWQTMTEMSAKYDFFIKEDDLLQCTRSCRCGAFFNMLMHTSVLVTCTSSLISLGWVSDVSVWLWQLTVLVKFWSLKFWYFQVRILLSSTLFVSFGVFCMHTFVYWNLPLLCTFGTFVF